MRVYGAPVTAALALWLAGCGGNPEAEPDGAHTGGAITVVDTARLVDEVAGARGSVLVVNFWATWCPPCVKEMPALARFYGEYSGKGVAFLSVSVDHPDLVDESVRPFVTAHALPFGIFVLDEPDPEKAGSGLKVDWGGAVPATFVFDRHGTLQRAWYEEITLSELARTVDPLLE